MDEIRTERLTPPIEPADVVSDDLLPKEGILAEQAREDARVDAREDAIDAAENSRHPGRSGARQPVDIAGCSHGLTSICPSSPLPGAPEPGTGHTTVRPRARAATGRRRRTS